MKFNDIHWIKADSNYLDLHTSDKIHTVRSSLGAFLSLLPPEKFYQVHRSYAINLEAINAVEPTLVRVSGKEVPLGPKYRPGLYAHLDLPQG